MRDEKQVLSETWSFQIDTYLDAVDRALLATDATRASRRSVIEMVEDQISEMCQTRLTDDSTDEEFRAMFAELDAPESFAAEFASEHSDASRTPSEPKISVSKLAVLAAALPVVAVLSYAASLMTQFGPFIALLFVSGMGTLFAPLIGWFALRQIEQSNSRITGRNLALIGIYAPILMVANALVGAATVMLPPVVLGLGMILLFGGLNLLLVRFIHRGLMAKLGPDRTHSADAGNGAATIVSPA